MLFSQRVRCLSDTIVACMVIDEPFSIDFNGLQLLGDPDSATFHLKLYKPDDGMDGSGGTMIEFTLKRAPKRMGTCVYKDI